jgi:hypothetical protein
VKELDLRELLKGFITFIAILSLISLIGIAVRPSISKKILSTVSQQGESQLKEFGFDIFRTPAKNIPPDVTKELRSEDQTRLKKADFYDGLFGNTWWGWLIRTIASFLLYEVYARIKRIGLTHKKIKGNVPGS